ncbi:OLC1v1038073C1 [Oldenlandia corymbosa var. corymbosa]|uniref:E2 ubiquitin-conjugating enzyme n=1 Tax=Oldenlandia corymbosa var. corymbosa TaxID=529605 RepID=A0AAV1CZ19_OLDCO|nr:OLC1v1038073C1 [Oldenlandia corymbosa var. corymbosa]
MDDEVVEIPPTASWRSARLPQNKQKESLPPEIIDVDMDEFVTTTQFSPGTGISNLGTGNFTGKPFGSAGSGFENPGFFSSFDLTAPDNSTGSFNGMENHGVPNCNLNNGENDLMDMFYPTASEYSTGSFNGVPDDDSFNNFGHNVGYKNLGFFGSPHNFADSFHDPFPAATFPGEEKYGFSDVSFNVGFQNPVPGSSSSSHNFMDTFHPSSTATFPGGNQKHGFPDGSFNNKLGQNVGYKNPGLPISPQDMFNPNFSAATFGQNAFSGLVGPSLPPLPTTTTTDSIWSFSNGKYKYGTPDKFLNKFEASKRFDVVEDFSDHFYSKNAPPSMKQPPRGWAKKIQNEWRILENDLPDTIFVRVYESSMDLLRAVVIGAEGTPYHDGLFFFDIFFPSNYPFVPPLVHYHSRGYRINPNLYETGKVCLSLLNTWWGSNKERWIPNQSTILQVLVSIQGLILNSKPYFNEPARPASGFRFEDPWKLYNENTFILSLKTMVCIIRNPPKNFQDLVAGHFFRRARDILVACKSYMDGAQVGCLVKGGIPDVKHRQGNTISCSESFKMQLAGYMSTLVEAFKAVSVYNCDEFLSLAHNLLSFRR